MKFLIFCSFALFALTHAQDCSEERAEGCVESLLAAILGDSTEEEACRELSGSIKCLRDAVNDCMDEEDEEVEEGLAELEKLLKENCEDADESESKDDESSEDSEMQQCFQENEDYMYECIYEGSAQALALVLETEGELNENTLQCAMYSMMADCFVERVGEKCGATAAKYAKEEMDDLPEEIAEACKETAGIEAHSFELLDKKK